MRKEVFFEALGGLDDDLVSSAVCVAGARRGARIRLWALAACLCLAVGLVSGFILSPNSTQVPASGGVLAQVEEIFPGGSCRVSVTGGDEWFNTGDALTVNYGGVHLDSAETDRALQIGDVIAVTYNVFTQLGGEQQSGEHIVTVTYVDLIKPAIRYPWVQEYLAGTGNIKGNVDVEKYVSKSADFAIGATSEGYAVFKDPYAAFDAFTALYARGIRRIQEACGLDDISYTNYSDYKLYGWQLTNGSAGELEEAKFISKFLDIYENSFTLN